MGHVISEQVKILLSIAQTKQGLLVVAAARQIR